MIAYAMLGILAILAFLCLSQVIPDLLQHRPSSGPSARQRRSTRSSKAQSPSSDRAGFRHMI